MGLTVALVAQSAGVHIIASKKTVTKLEGCHAFRTQPLPALLDEPVFELRSRDVPPSKIKMNPMKRVLSIFGVVDDDEGGKHLMNHLGSMVTKWLQEDDKSEALRDFDVPGEPTTPNRNASQDNLGDSSDGGVLQAPKPLVDREELPSAAALRNRSPAFILGHVLKLRPPTQSSPADGKGGEAKPRRSSLKRNDDVDAHPDL